MASPPATVRAATPAVATAAEKAAPPARIQLLRWAIGPAAPATTLDRVKPPGAPFIHGRHGQKRHVMRGLWSLGKKVQHKLQYRVGAAAAYGVTAVLLVGYIFDWKLVTNKIPLYNTLKDKYPEPTQNM